MTGPLDGIEVLEFSEVIAAPSAGMMLADLGAEVIKVEPPWGEQWRMNQQIVPSESRGFIAVNRGKRSLLLDLTKPEAQEIAHEITRRVDVVLVNYRPDVPLKLGIDYETLSRLNPRLVYGEATAFGEEGPNNKRPGYDVIAQAVSGLIANDQKFVDDVPSLYQATPFVDFYTGSVLAGAVIAALYAREKTDRGQKVTTSLLQSGLALQGLRSVWIEAIDQDRHQEFISDLEHMRADQRSIGDAIDRYNQFQGRRKGNQRYFYRTYATKDGAVAVGCLSPALRRRLLSVLGISGDGELSTDPASHADDEIMRKAVEIFATDSTDHWVAACDAQSVPVGPIRFAEELWDDEQVLANKMSVEVEHALLGRIKMASPLAKMSGVPAKVLAASPALGQHTDAILSELGYDDDHIATLRRSGVTV